MAGSAALDRGADAPRAARLLLLTQRFTPKRAPASNPLAESLVATRGETEGFQLVVRSPGGRLQARLGAATDAFLARRTRIVRVGFVRVRTPSTAIGRPGLYADPLPPQTGAGMETRAGQLAGFAVLVDVPADAEPGRYAGTVEMATTHGRVIATARFRLRVAAVRALAPSDPRSFRVAGGVSDGWYERLAPIGGYSAVPRRERQQRNLLAFLASHGSHRSSGAGLARAGTGGTPCVRAESRGRARRCSRSSSACPGRSGCCPREVTGSGCSATGSSAARSTSRTSPRTGAHAA